MGTHNESYAIIEEERNGYLEKLSPDDEGGQFGVRVVLADPYALIRASLRALLDAQSGIEVIDATGDGTEAVRLACRHEPDVILLEILLEQPSGFTTINQIASSESPARSLVLTQCDQPWMVQEAMNRGASGYLLKQDPFSFLLKAVHQVTSGKDGWVSPTLTKSALVPEISSVAWARRKLTAREWEVLCNVTEGLSNREIAEQLFITPGTVRNHVANILNKLDISSRAKLVAWANKQDITALFPL